MAGATRARKWDGNDLLEMAVVILAFLFSMVFLLRLGEPVGSKVQFQAQNGVNLLVASILTAAVLGLFLGRTDCLLTFRSVGPYVASGLTTGMTAYLMTMFELPAWANWVCLVVGFAALLALTVLAIRTRTPGSMGFATGMWVVMAVSSATGIHIVSSEGFLAILVLGALAGTFVGVMGLFEVLDNCRSVFDRFGYSAAAFSLLMVWLSTSRTAASGVAAGYSSLDWVMAIAGTAFSLIGASVIAHRRFLDNQIRQALGEGHDAYQDADYRKAVDAYEKALTLRPASKIARTCKADAVAQLKDYEAAIKLYDSVLKDDRDYIPAISGKGSALRQNGDLAKSVIYLQRALNIDPDNKVAWNNKGNAFFFLDELKTAIYCYKKAIEKDPTYSGAWYNLAVAYTNTGDFLEADYAFRTATNLIERKELAEERRLKVTKAGRAAKGGVSEMFDRPGGVSVEMLMGDAEKRVLAHISYNPGATQVDVAEALTLGEGEAKAILARLARSGLVATRIDGTRRRYYPKEQLPVMIDVQEIDGGAIRERKVRYLTDLQKRLVDEVEASPGLTAKELSERMRVGKQVLDFHLETLTRGEVLTTKRSGTTTRYFVR